MTILTVRHLTTYRYKRPVSFGEHRMMLRPHESHDQRLLDFRLEISPKPAELRWIQDVFGNHIAVARFAGRANALHFVSTIRLDHSATSIADPDIEDFARAYPFTYGEEDMPYLVRFIERHFPDPEQRLNHWAQRFLRHGSATNTRELFADMTQTIRKTFTHVARHEKASRIPWSRSKPEKAVVATSPC